MKSLAGNDLANYVGVTTLRIQRSTPGSLDPRFVPNCRLKSTSRFGRTRSVDYIAEFERDTRDVIVNSIAIFGASASDAFGVTSSGADGIKHKGHSWSPLWMVP